MEYHDVPQHNISTYANNKKAMYATDKNGDYGIIASSGWKVEEEVTKQALAELERLSATAYKEVAAGLKSPLYYHMYNRRMDLQTLAQSTGLFKWRIKRHFSPRIFTTISHKLLLRYSDALGISTTEISTLPKEIKEK